MSLIQDIPGYREAVERETETRDAAFLDIPLTLKRRWPRRPLRVLPLTIRRMLVLEHCRSPFICGPSNAITAGAIAQFLWVCSPDFTPDKKRRDKFIHACRTVNAAAALEIIYGMVNEAFYDSPASEVRGGESASYWSMAASLVDSIAREYGWTENEILDAPLSRILQYFKVIQHRCAMSCGSKIPLFNPSDRVKARWLETVNAGVANG